MNFIIKSLLKNLQNKKTYKITCRFLLEAPPRFELGNKGFADLCLTTWLWRHTWWLDQESNQGHEDFQSSALPTELSSLNKFIIVYYYNYVNIFIYIIFFPLIYHLSNFFLHIKHYFIGSKYTYIVQIILWRKS